MMVMTAKVNLKKVMIALAAVAALIVALILLLGGGGDSAETSAPTASSNDGRVKFLTDLGWDVTTSPTDSSQVRIPPRPATCSSATTPCKKVRATT